MTVKARWNAAMRMQAVDRLPFWPKIFDSYRQAQPEPFRSWALAELHEWIGSDRHEFLEPALVAVRKTTSRESAQEEDGVLRTRYRTRFGELLEESRWDAPTQSWHPTRHPVQTREDLRAMTAYYEDENWAVETAAMAREAARHRELGESAFTGVCAGESPLMAWVETLAGVERGHLLLADCRPEVDALLAAMHASLLRRVRLLAERHPADCIYLMENTSTTLISPAQYRRYCKWHIGEYAAEAGYWDRLVVLHMCGHLKALLPDLEELPVAAFEAFTSPPLGNTTLVEGRRECPTKCLVGGTNAVLWTQGSERIVDELRQHLDRLPHHRGIVVTSAGVMPPRARPESIREVCRWVQSYPVKRAAA